MTVRPTISEVLAEYLAAEKKRVSPRTFAKYTDVIELLKHSLDRYAPNGLEATEHALWEKHFNADGDAHKEFCDVFGPEHILPNVGEFLNYFMVHKVMAGNDLLRASGTVTKKLARWLAEHGYVAIDDAALALEQGADAARDLPAAAKLAALLYDLMAARFTPRESDIEGRFGITKVESRRIWLRDEDDGRDYGAVPVPEAVTKLCRHRLDDLRRRPPERQGLAPGGSVRRLPVGIENATQKTKPDFDGRGQDQPRLRECRRRVCRRSDRRDEPAYRSGDRGHV
jgi:hypothetical protein